MLELPLGKVGAKIDVSPHQSVKKVLCTFAHKHNDVAAAVRISWVVGVTDQKRVGECDCLERMVLVRIDRVDNGIEFFDRPALQ